MKTLLIATDFSANAKHAAEYGYRLASKLKTNLILCNAFILPAEVPGAGFVSWPLYEYDELQKDSVDELNKLKIELEMLNSGDEFKPVLTCISDTGTVSDTIQSVAEKKDVSMIIMSTHGSNGLTEFLIGNHSRTMIEDSCTPLLLVPASAEIKNPKKIAFATDFESPKKDLETIYELIDLIRPLNAELLITHIRDDKEQSPEFKKWLYDFLAEISNKANYPHIYYRIVKGTDTERGLDWLCEHGHIDILAMVHREHNFFERMFKGSHTQKMAKRISIPLLVLPEKK